MLFVFVCKTWNVTKPGAWLARPLQGLNNLKIYPPFYLWCCKSCTHSRQSLPVTPSHSQSLPVRAVSRQVRSKVRGCSALSVKSKQDYFCTVPQQSTPGLFRLKTTGTRQNNTSSLINSISNNVEHIVGFSGNSPFTVIDGVFQ